MLEGVWFLFFSFFLGTYPEDVKGKVAEGADDVDVKGDLGGGHGFFEGL